jgi:hypothetical protein
MLYLKQCSNIVTLLFSSILSDSDGLLKIDDFVMMFIDSAILRSLLRFLPLCGYTRGLV